MDGFFLIIKMSVFRNKVIVYTIFTYCICHTRKVYMFRPKHSDFQTSQSFAPQMYQLNPLNPELNSICYLLALLAHHFLHVSRIRVKSLTIRPRSQQASGRRPLACWDRGFESHRGHGYLSVVSVVCCQVEVSATSWSLVQRSPTDCAAWLCVI